MIKLFINFKYPLDNNINIKVIRAKSSLKTRGEIKKTASAKVSVTFVSELNC